eukprot:scaffold23150_cov124-Isochrysis_galbana.AAC.1
MCDGCRDATSGGGDGVGREDGAGWVGVAGDRVEGGRVAEGWGAGSASGRSNHQREIQVGGRAGGWMGEGVHGLPVGKEKWAEQILTGRLLYSIVARRSSGAEELRRREGRRRREAATHAASIPATAPLFAPVDFILGMRAIFLEDRLFLGFPQAVEPDQIWETQSTVSIPASARSISGDAHRSHQP